MKNKIFILITLSLFSFKCFSFDNYYKMLGVSENASTEEIKKGYRKMAMKYHPDRNSGSIVASEIFKKVQGAYDVLSDPSKRVMFDKALQMQPKARPKAAVKEAPSSTASKAQKYTWENFDQKPDVKPQPKQEEKPRPEAKAEPKTEAKVKAAPETTGSDVKTTKVDTSVSNPMPEKTPVRNPKLDLYKAVPSCNKGFLGTVIDTLI